MSNTSQVIHIEQKEITVKKLPIIKYAEMLKLIKELPKHLTGIDKMDTATLIEQIPFFIGVALPDLLAIIRVACEDQLTQKEVESLGLAETTDLLVAIFEVNDYASVFERLKKVMPKKTDQLKPATSTN